MSSSKLKTSSVWSFYLEENGTPYASCKKCLMKIKRGKEGSKKNWSSKPLWTHLEAKHPVDYRKAMEERDIANSATKKRKLDEEERQAVYVSGTPKLAAFLDKKEKYQPDNSTQKQITEALTTWIADGVLPYNMIDNERFVRFSQSS